ncbi:unnamed protein product [Ilex paraguariensis]|uniref:Uncharacterized protein n=1 Tax=Ilex paraguariensis TaxID=185542 RepID=A0ABC8TXD9_9AQUA
MDSSSPSVSALQFALAALFGASVVALSAFYVHKRSVDQVLDRLIKLRRKSPPPVEDRFFISDEDAEDEQHYTDVLAYGGERDESDDREYMWRDGVFTSLGDDSVINGYRISCSMPNVCSSSGWMNDEANTDRRMSFGANQALSNSLNNLSLISSNLQSLRTDLRDAKDQYGDNSGSKMRVEFGGRLMTPISLGGYAFESAGDSDEEGTEFETGDEFLFTNENINSSAELEKDINSSIHNPSNVPSKADNVNHMQVQRCTSIANKENVSVDHGDGKINTGSVHVIGNDPMFASSTVPLTISVHESTNIEDEQVLKMIRECLDLRDKYVFREKVAPWMQETGGKSSPSNVNSDPFHFVPFETTSHCFRMEDGVVHIYAREKDTEDLFPVASSTTFFTDMHHILKAISIGNVRSVCHLRLRFLEEKFRLHLLVHADREF